MPQTTIQSTLDAVAKQQADNEFGSQRYALLFQPGTYGSAADPLVFQVGYYTSVAGLGRNPGDVVINGSVDTYNRCLGGGTSGCVATDNFWRSVSNLTVNVAGQSGCYANTDFWASSQDSPLRRVHINGNLTLMDYCTGSPDWASGGFIADSQFTGGTVINGSQQQYLTRNSSLDGWTNSVWNQVFCGSPGAPAQSFASNSGDPGGPSSYTTLATCPVTREAPYLYTDAHGAYRVFVPATQRNSSGPTWLGAGTPGRSLPLSSFYVARPGSGAEEIAEALREGKNLLLTPGVYDIPETLRVRRPDTVILGLGFPTLVPQHGATTMSVADVPGVSITGLIFDAGTNRSRALLTLGGPSFGDDRHQSDPVAVHDVAFRVGGAQAGTVQTAFVDDSADSIIDDVWVWRADHGAGGGVWTSDQAATGLVVDADHVTAYGLAVEHFQKDETVWNGQHGTVIFFQNENPYDVPSQSAWMANPGQKGYPAFRVGRSVTTFQGYGMGSYSYFNQGVDIHNAMAFQAPSAPGVQFHDLLTVFLNGSGGIDSVINGTGAPVNSASHGPSDVVSSP
jgi:hypothetical protein